MCQGHWRYWQRFRNCKSRSGPSIVETEQYILNISKLRMRQWSNCVLPKFDAVRSTPLWEYPMSIFGHPLKTHEKKSLNYQLLSRALSQCLEILQPDTLWDSKDWASLKIHVRSNPRWPTAGKSVKVAAIVSKLSQMYMKSKTMALCSDDCPMSSTNYV